MAVLARVSGETRRPRQLLVALLTCVALLVATPASSTDNVEAASTDQSFTLAVSDLSSLVAADRVSVKTQWRRVDFPRPFSEPPIVVVGPASYKGAQPVTVRVANASTTDFDIRLKEWPYLDGNHTFETVSYLAVPAGRHVLPSGAIIEAGTSWVGPSDTAVAFAAAFDGAPTLLTTLHTDAGPALAIRTEVTSTGFVASLSPQEADPATSYKTINWVAWSQGSEPTAIDGVAWQSGAEDIKHKWYDVSFDRRYVKSCVLADMNSLNGGDPATVRYRNLSGRSVDLRLAEERSADSEVAHTFETVGVLVVDCAQGPPIAEPEFDFGDTLVGTPIVLKGWAFGGSDEVTRVGVAIRHRDTRDWLQADGTFATQLARFDADLQPDFDGRYLWSYTVELGEDDYSLSLRVWDSDGNAVDLTPYRHFTVAHEPTATGILLDTAGDVGLYTSIELDSAGSPVIAYVERTSFDPSEGIVKVIHCEDPQCSSFAGPHGVADVTFDWPETRPTTNLDMELDSAGVPTIAMGGRIIRCIDVDCAQPPSVEFQGPPDGISMELDDNGYPVISGGWGLQVAHCTDAACANDPVVGPTVPGNDVIWTSLDLDDDGHPVVASWDWSSESSRDLAVTRCSDPWCQDPASYSPLDFGFSEVDWKTISMALDEDSNPVMVIKQPNPEVNTFDRMQVIACGDPQCLGPVVATEIATNQEAGQWASLVIGPDGNPIVAFDNLLVGGRQRDVMLAYCTDHDCEDGPERVIVDNEAWAQWISFVVDSVGNAYVSYYDAIDGDLRFAFVPRE